MSLWSNDVCSLDQWIYYANSTFYITFHIAYQLFFLQKCFPDNDLKLKLVENLKKKKLHKTNKNITLIISYCVVVGNWTLKFLWDFHHLISFVEKLMYLLLKF